MQPYSAPDQVANGLVQLATLFANKATKARQIDISASGTTPARFGDANIGAAQGMQIPTGVSPTVIRTNVGDITDWIDLTQVYVFTPSGTTASIIVWK